MIEDHLSLEDLLLATLDAVSRFRVGQRDTVSAALEAGPNPTTNYKPNQCPRRLKW